MTVMTPRIMVYNKCTQNIRHCAHVHNYYAHVACNDESSTWVNGIHGLCMHSVDKNADLNILFWTRCSTASSTARSSQDLELWLQEAVFQVIGKRGLRAWRKVCHSAFT